MNDQKKEYLASMDLKGLRQERKESINRVRENVKNHNKIIKSIKEQLTETAQTIPMLAEALVMDTDTVLRYVSTLKKYGIIGEVKKEGEYFSYLLLQ